MVELAFAVAQLNWRYERLVVVPVGVVEVANDKARHESCNGVVRMVGFNLISGITTDKVKYGKLATRMGG